MFLDSATTGLFNSLKESNFIWIILTFATILGGIAALQQFWQQRKKPSPIPGDSLSQFIVLKKEKEIDKVLKSQLFLETPEGRIGGRNWDEIKETVYYAKEYEFSEMKEGNILIIHGDIGIGKTTYLLFFVADCLRKREHVIFIDPSFLDGSLKELRGKKGQLIAIDAFERVKGDFKERCSELINFARHNHAKIILTMRNHKWAEFKNVAAHEHYEVKEIIPKPHTDHIPYIVANYLLFFNVNAYGLNAEDAHRIIYNNMYELYPELWDALKIIKEKSNVSPFYIFHTIKELKKKKLVFEISTIKDLPVGVEKLLLNTLKTDFSSGGIEDDVFIAMLICLSDLEKDFSIGLVDAIHEELVEFFSLEKGENIIIINNKVRNRIDQFIGHFMVKTTNFEVLLPVYWRDAIEKALKRSMDDDISTVFLRVKRRINVKNVIENSLKRGLEKSRIDNEYFHSVADGAKQGFLDYAYQKFKDIKETKGISEDRNYAIGALTNEFLIRGNNYFRTKKQDLRLFSWDEILENNNRRLIEFLKQKFDIDWAKTATIEKINDDKTIRVFSEKTSLSLRLNDEKTKVNLTIDNGRTDEFIARIENGKLYIYSRDLTQYEKAIENYDKVIEINPNFIEAYINRAIAKNKLDMYEDAIKDLEYIIKVNPDNANAYNSIGINYAWLGNRDSAFSCYEKAMRLNSEDPLPYYNRAMLYEEIKELENAEKDYEMAIKLKPDFDGAYYKLAVLLEEMGKYDKAKVYYEKMIKLKFGFEALEN